MIPPPTAAAVATLRLTLTRGVGELIGRRLLDAAGGAEALWRMGPEGWRTISGVGDRLVAALERAAAFDPAPLLARCARAGIGLCAIDDDTYPPQLAACDDAPLLLFYRGNLAALTAPRMVAVVGARRATQEGIAVTRRWSRFWAEAGAVIVSGMAPGIDSAAHHGALKAHAPSVAVLGFGIAAADTPRRRQIEALCDGGGCVVSELPPQTRARAHFFPRRNRIIAGLTPATVVMEAARRSGSLITARRALEYGRELFAVPGSVLGEGHRGCHALIREGAAQLLDAPGQLCDALGWSPADCGPPPTAAPENETEEIVCRLLAREPRHIDALVEESGLTLSCLSPALLALEMRGVIERLPGNRYALTHPD
ncbi:MAG: DNA-protecting protein DprA [Zetaproteobacteria bacterium]|nr:MAG: DNA-protecting protein DprA [Zetaproteobacteria bacterium]